MQAFPLRYYANFVCYKSRISTKKGTAKAVPFFIPMREFIAILKNRNTASPCEPLRADADAITEASRSLSTNPLISTKKNTAILQYFFIQTEGLAYRHANGVYIISPSASISLRLCSVENTAV